MPAMQVGVRLNPKPLILNMAAMQVDVRQSHRSAPREAWDMGPGRGHVWGWSAAGAVRARCSSGRADGCDDGAMMEGPLGCGHPPAPRMMQLPVNNQ